MLKGGTNYTMIRRAIFGKVHGHGVIKLKVTRKYWANCRINARRRKKIKNNFLFKVG